MGRSVANPLSAGTLAKALNAELIGDAEILIRSVSSLDAAIDGALSFFADNKHRAAAVRAVNCILLARDADRNISSGTRLIHPAPHMAFAQALDLLFPAENANASICAPETCAVASTEACGETPATTFSAGNNRSKACANAI